MPVCDHCGKESNNLRMCPFCHAAYQPQNAASRRTGSSAAPRQSKLTPRASMAGMPGPPGTAGRPRPTKATLSPAFKFGVPSLIIAFGAWYFVIAGERRIPAGVVMANIVTVPMTRLQAEALLRQDKGGASVETRGDGIAVTFPRASWPERREGQLALAQQYARAVEMIEGKKKKIEFYDPSGTLCAKGDALGVMMVR